MRTSCVLVFGLVLLMAWTSESQTSPISERVSTSGKFCVKVDVAQRNREIDNVTHSNFISVNSTHLELKSTPIPMQSVEHPQLSKPTVARNQSSIGDGNGEKSLGETSLPGLERHEVSVQSVEGPQLSKPTVARTQSSIGDRNGEKSLAETKLIHVLKTNKSLTGLEQHEGPATLPSTSVQNIPGQPKPPALCQSPCQQMTPNNNPVKENRRNYYDGGPVALAVPKRCCFNFIDFQLPTKKIVSAEKTNSHCPSPGILVTTPRTEFCVKPDEAWIKSFIEKQPKK